MEIKKILILFYLFGNLENLFSTNRLGNNFKKNYDFKNFIKECPSINSVYLRNALYDKDNFDIVSKILEDQGKIIEYKNEESWIDLEKNEISKTEEEIRTNILQKIKNKTIKNSEEIINELKVYLGKDFVEEDFYKAWMMLFIQGQLTKFYEENPLLHERITFYNKWSAENQKNKKFTEKLFPWWPKYEYENKSDFNFLSENIDNIYKILKSIAENDDHKLYEAQEFSSASKQKIIRNNDEMFDAAVKQKAARNLTNMISKDFKIYETFQRKNNKKKTINCKDDSTFHSDQSTNYNSINFSGDSLLEESIVFSDVSEEQIEKLNNNFDEAVKNERIITLELQRKEILKKKQEIIKKSEDRRRLNLKKKEQKIKEIIEKLNHSTDNQKKASCVKTLNSLKNKRSLGLEKQQKNLKSKIDRINAKIKEINKEIDNEKDILEEISKRIKKRIQILENIKNFKLINEEKDEQNEEDYENKI